MSRGDRARLERLKSSSERACLTVGSPPSSRSSPTQRPLPSPPGHSLPRELNGSSGEATASSTASPLLPIVGTPLQSGEEVQQGLEPRYAQQRALFIKPRAEAQANSRNQSPVGRHRRSVTVVERPTFEAEDMDSGWKRFDFEAEQASGNRSRVDRVVVDDEPLVGPPSGSPPPPPPSDRSRVERVTVGLDEEGTPRNVAPPIPTQPSPSTVPQLALGAAVGVIAAVSPPDDSQFPPVPPRKAAAGPNASGPPKRCLPPTPGGRSGGILTARGHDDSRGQAIPPRRGSFDSAETTAHARQAHSPQGKGRGMQKTKLQNVGARFHQLPAGGGSGVPVSVSSRPLPSVKSPTAVRRPLPQPRDAINGASSASKKIAALKGTTASSSSGSLPQIRDKRIPTGNPKKRSVTLADLGDLETGDAGTGRRDGAGEERSRSPTVGTRPHASTPPRRVGEGLANRGDPVMSPPRAKNFMRSPDVQPRGAGGRGAPAGRGRGAPLSSAPSSVASNTPNTASGAAAGANGGPSAGAGAGSGSGSAGTSGAPTSPIGPPMRHKQTWRASTEHRIANAEAGKHTMASSADDAKNKSASSPLRYAVPTIPSGAVFPVRASTNCLFTPVPTSTKKSTENAAAYNREIRAFLQNIHNFQVRQHLTARVLRGGTGTSLLKPVMGDTAPAPSLASLKISAGPEEEPAAHPMQAVWDRWIDLENEARNPGGLLCMTTPEDEDSLPIIKGGVVEQLVERLTHAGFPDPEYLSAFLLTYRSFTSPENFLEMMIKNFTVPDPVSHKDREFLEYFHDAVRKPIQFRTCSTFKIWMEKHWYDFENSPALVSRLRAWLSSDLEKSGYKNLAQMLEKVIKKREQGAKKGVLHIRQDMPPPIAPKPGAKFIDFSPVEVARQICLIEFQDYKKIHPTECMHQSWTKKNKAEAAPNIGKMIKRSNVLPLWVATQILSEAEGKLRNRAKIVSNFIKIASELRKVNNFNAVMEISAGLQLSPIYRLKKTWELVPKKLLEVLEELQEGFKSNGNWKNYRSALKQCAPPCLPYLGLYLTDLTFIEDGHPDELATDDENISMVNFLKCRQLAVVIREIQQFQQCAYAFEKVDPIYDYLQSLEILSEEELFDLSLELEPREE